MLITLTPQYRPDTLTLARAGDALILNGETFDFSALEDGQMIPVSAIASTWFAGDAVRRVAGTLHMALILPHGSFTGDDARYPAPIVNPPDGPIPLPAHTLPGVPPR